MTKKLFEIKDLRSPSERFTLQSTLNAHNLVSKKQFKGKAGLFVKELDDLLNSEDPHIDFVTAGSISLHTIIEFLLQKYGHCLEMYMSTWAIKEAAARSLFSLKSQGLIGSIHGIFDYRVKTVDSQAFQLVEQIFTRFELTKNHSKVILLDFPDHCLTILCSANLSNNPRIEAGFISSNPKIFQFHKGWMLNVFNGKKVY